MAVSGHDLTKTRDCKVPGCTNDAPTHGRFAGLCTEHRDTVAGVTGASRNGATSAATGTEKALRDLLALAKRVDKAKAKAETLRKQANEADRLADALEAEYRDALAAAARGAV